MTSEKLKSNCAKALGNVQSCIPDDLYLERSTADHIEIYIKYLEARLQECHKLRDDLIRRVAGKEHV